MVILAVVGLCWLYFAGKLSNNDISFIQTLIFLISAIVAWITLQAAQTNHRQANYIKILQEKKTERFLTNYYIYRDLVNEQFDFSQLIKKKYLDKRRAVSFILNHYELIAIGIKRKVFDKEICWKLEGENIIDMYRETSKFIDALRQQKGQETVYEELRKLVTEEWAKQYNDYHKKLNNN